MSTSQFETIPEGSYSKAMQVINKQRQDIETLTAKLSLSQDNLDALTANACSLQDRVNDLESKLAQVEADAAVMREALRFVHSNWSDCCHDACSTFKICNAVQSGSGQRLLEELAQYRKERNFLCEVSGHPIHSAAPLSSTIKALRDSAQRRLELLKELECDPWTGKCYFCRQRSKEAGHKPNCPLAAELKESK